MNWEEFEFKVRNMIELSFGLSTWKVPPWRTCWAKKGSAAAEIE